MGQPESVRPLLRRIGKVDAYRIASGSGMPETIVQALQEVTLRDMKLAWIPGELR